MDSSGTQLKVIRPSATARQYERPGIDAAVVCVAIGLLAGARAEAAPPKELAQLEVQHAERTRQLELTVKELDSFSHSVSHDLRAPLRVVDGFANIVLEDYGERLDDLGREHLKRIVAAGQRMNAMIDTLLSLSRMTSREIERERVDLSRLAHELADELRAQDPARATEFALAEGIVVDGDRTLLRLVLQNLMGNAWKFSGKVARPRVEVEMHLWHLRQDHFLGELVMFANQ